MTFEKTMRAFWGGKRVFITGHTGFKGSWLCLWLKLLGAKVTGYALEPPTTPSLFDLAEVSSGMESIIADVRDLDRLSEAIEDCQPEIIFHLAAQSLVRESYSDPVGTYSTNVMGTVNILESARRTESVRVVVNITSDKCYAPADHSHREDDPFGGDEPYSSSKGCAELVTWAYRKSFMSCDGGAAVASARAGNVIGGGDWATDRLIPDCIRAISKSQPVIIRNPAAVRPWQHVIEPLSGYLLLARKLWDHGSQYAEGWNFGPEEIDLLPVSGIADRITQLWGQDAKWVHDKSTQPYEVPYLRLDCSKVKDRLGWEPKINIDQALQWVVDWHKRVLSGETARTVSIEQIEKFLTANDND